MATAFLLTRNAYEGRIDIKHSTSIIVLGFLLAAELISLQSRADAVGAAAANRASLREGSSSPRSEHADCLSSAIYRTAVYVHPGFEVSTRARLHLRYARDRVKSAVNSVPLWVAVPTPRGRGASPPSP
jgi:hypothetical protein